MDHAKSPVLFYIAIAFTIVAVLLCIYAAIPNINHVFVPEWAEPTKVHDKYVELFGGLAVLGLVGVFLARPKSSAR